jgi:hypothetical protein
MPKNPKRPRDPNQLAKMIMDMSIGEAAPDVKPEKNAAAVELGRLGGLKGGKARSASLSPEKRKEIAQKAAAKRWGKT